MIEISEDTYKQLVKDADDNRQMVKIVTRVIIAIVFVIFVLVYGHRPIDIWIERYQASVQNEIALEKAHNNAEIMEIERGDMTMDEYLKWLEVRGDLYSISN